MCCNPKKSWLVGVKNNGKSKLIITDWKVDHLTPDNVPKKFKNKINFSNNYGFRYVPCGYCEECRLNKAKDWNARCVMESKYHVQSMFITLTYDDVHVPYGHYTDDDGVIHQSMTLEERISTSFMKQLRNVTGIQGLKFIMSAEYGDKTFRPHYHFVVFGLTLPDLQWLKDDNLGKPVFVSKTLNDIWKKGFVQCSVLDGMAAAGYVARYTLKKAYQSKEYYGSFGLIPPYFRCSQGIGKRFYEDNGFKEVYYISTDDGSIRVDCPRYFLKLFEKQDPVEYSNFVSKRVSRCDEVFDLIQLKTPLDVYFDSKKERFSRTARNLNSFKSL